MFIVCSLGRFYIDNLVSMVFKRGGFCLSVGLHMLQGVFVVSGQLPDTSLRMAVKNGSLFAQFHPAVVEDFYLVVESPYQMLMGSLQGSRLTFIIRKLC